MAAKKVVAVPSEARKMIYHRNPSNGLYYADEASKKEIIKNLSKEGQTIANALGDNLNVTEEGNIIYAENSFVGSPLIILIEWYLNRKTAQERPLDYEFFQKLIHKSEIKIPKNWIK